MKKFISRFLKLFTFKPSFKTITVGKNNLVDMKMKKLKFVFTLTLLISAGFLFLKVESAEADNWRPTSFTETVSTNAEILNTSNSLDGSYGDTSTFATIRGTNPGWSCGGMPGPCLAYVRYYYCDGKTTTTLNIKHRSWDSEWSIWVGDNKIYEQLRCSSKTTIETTLVTLPAGSTNFYLYFGGNCAGNATLEIYDIYLSGTENTSGFQGICNAQNCPSCLSPYVCKYDYDGSGSWCCNSDQCAHDGSCSSSGSCSGQYKCQSGSWTNHCANGSQDCDETGTDCGGSCPACITDNPPITTVGPSECKPVCEKNLNEVISVTVSATDDYGVNQLWLYTNGEQPNDRWEEVYVCSGTTFCSHTWNITLDWADEIPDGTSDWTFWGISQDTAEQWSEYDTISVNVTSGVTNPVVTNSTGASNITHNSARLNGEVTYTGGEDPTVHIYWGDNDAGTVSANWDHNENLGEKGLVTFYKDISGLNPSTPYYYRCYASNSAGSDWADSTASFTTAEYVPDQGFTTILRPYPYPDFTPSPSNPNLNAEVTFLDNSKCYNDSLVEYDCKTNSNIRYQWNFNAHEDAVIDCDSGVVPDSPCRGNATTSYSTMGGKTISLKITDDLGTCTSTEEISVFPPLPEWKETAPF